MLKYFGRKMTLIVADVIAGAGLLAIAFFDKKKNEDVVFGLSMLEIITMFVDQFDFTSI